MISASYGTAADNFIDAEFVGHDGEIFRLNDKSSQNLFAFSKEDSPIPGICSSVDIRLHKIIPDEGAAFVPFGSLDSAFDFAKECAQRRIGIAIGVLGGEYLSVFLSPTQDLAKRVKDTFRDKLKIEYIVLVIGDKYALQSIKEMGFNYFDNHLIRILNLGLHSLTSACWLDLINELGGDEPFSYLGLKHFPDLAEAALAPSPSQLVNDVDPELRPFFEKLYSLPHMTDPVWLNMFRIISARMGREKHVLAIIIYLPIDNMLISEINSEFKRIADSHDLKNDYGFITPLDEGKRCVFEYDYYLDHTDPGERKRAQQAMKSRAKYFHLISSAYAAGTDMTDCFEGPVASEHFNNVYEESKALAENLVSQNCIKESLAFTIIRPSVVYGDSVTGRSLRFNALYYPVRSLQIIRDIYLKDIKFKNGKKSSECGIHLNNNDILHLPVRIFIPYEGRINLIPVNYFTEALFSILENPSNGTYYHLTSSNPTTMAKLVAYTRRFLNISGVEVVTGKPDEDELKNPAEELFGYYIREYKPYFADRRNFISENMKRAKPDLVSPDLSYEIFERCMSFAVSVDWGRNLFNKLS